MKRSPVPIVVLVATLVSSVACAYIVLPEGLEVPRQRMPGSGDRHLSR
jgi:hypothetical protein